MAHVAPHSALHAAEAPQRPQQCMCQGFKVYHGRLSVEGCGRNVVDVGIRCGGEGAAAAPVAPSVLPAAPPVVAMAKKAGRGVGSV